MRNWEFSEGRLFGFSSLRADQWPAALIIRTAWEWSQGDKDEFYRVFLIGWQLVADYRRSSLAHQVLQLPANSNFSKKLPSWAALPPWEEKTIAEFKAWYPKAVRRNRASNGLPIPWYLNDAKALQFDQERNGPSHANQYWNLLKSVSERGFDESINTEDPVLVVELNNGFDLRWLIHSGNHRIAVLSALGLLSVSAERKYRVSREDCLSWRNVAVGTYSEQEALTIFDRTFDGIANPKATLMMKALSEKLKPFQPANG